MSTIDHDPRIYTGEGGYWVSRLARDEAVFRIEETERGVKLHLPEAVYFVTDASRPGGVRLTIPAGDHVHRPSLLDWNASSMLATQRAVQRLSERER